MLVTLPRELVRRDHALRFTVAKSTVSTNSLTKKTLSFVKILIPKSTIKRIKQELLTCGIDEITIYPDLDGLGRFLTTVLKVEASQIWVAGATVQNK